MAKHYAIRLLGCYGSVHDFYNLSSYQLMIIPFSGCTSVVLSQQSFFVLSHNISIGNAYLSGSSEHILDRIAFVVFYNL